MHENNLLPINDVPTTIPTKVYRKRWYILFIFVYYSCLSAVQMIEYSSITGIVAKYYSISNFAVNWTTIVYMVLYPIFVFPASYIIEKHGLRVACLFGCLGTALGTILKIFSIGTDRFWVVMVGQFLTAASQVFIMCLPPKIAAVWFKTNEISLACSLGTLGPNMGNAFGYLLTVSLVTDNEDVNIIGKNLKTLCWTITILIIPVSIAVIHYYPKQPLLPPSQVQARLRQKCNIYVTKSKLSQMKDLIRSKGFLTHMVSYSINIGVFATIMTLLSEFVNAYFDDASEDAGRMGFCMMAFGLIGSIAFGVYLDKFHHYKGTCIFLYIMSTTCVILFILSLEWHLKYFAYAMCSIFGIFINPYIPVGFEFGIELTYPNEESTVAGLLFAASQIFSVIFAVTVAHVNSYFGSLYALIVLAVLLGIGTLVEACVPNRLMRQSIFQKDIQPQSVT